MKQIPNLFTLLNLVFGCLAIIFIFKTDDFLFKPDSGGFSIGLIIGAACIFLAAIVDFFDGFVARLFKASSPMGAQLDSLADAVSFGVAPGMILYSLLQVSLKHAGIYDNIWYALPALLFPCAAVWRLAKFNLDKEQAYYFKGMPTPAAGLIIASFPLIIYYSEEIENSFFYNLYLLYAVIIIVSVLMVSNLPLISLKFKNFTIKSNIDKVIILLISILSIIFFKWLAVPVIFVAYVLVSLIFRPNKV